MKNLTGIFFVPLLFVSCMENHDMTVNEPLLPPEEIYGELFYAVQNDPRLFHDSKTFVDAVPLMSPEKIREDYTKLCDRSTEGLRKFLGEHFMLPSEHVDYVVEAGDVTEHIAKLWKVLQRNAYAENAGTLLSLPCNYIVPGGRFREIYYWDSYFTMLGLRADKEYQIIRDMLCNLEDAIKRFGFIPNGNRTYYLSRSQPPFFSLIVKLQAALPGGFPVSHYRASLEKEYAFWMDGAEKLDKDHTEYRRVVLMPGGEVLNRYYDDRPHPRPESYLEDQHTLQEARLILPDKKEQDVFRDIRAAAESGWDFSSRWLEHDSNAVYRMGTIRTTEIVPVDLNCLLYHLEMVIAEAYEGNESDVSLWRERAGKRKEAILKYCWDPVQRFFMDFDMKRQHCTDAFTLAGMYPLFFGIASEEQALYAAGKIKSDFLQPGGVVTSLRITGQQWDAPNGWAPLHYMTHEALMRYGYQELAAEIRERWMRLIEKTFAFNGRLLEKYNVQDTTKEGGGGEYPNQDGFGWTNGVYRYFEDLTAL